MLRREHEWLSLVSYEEHRSGRGIWKLAQTCLEDQRLDRSAVIRDEFVERWHLGTNSGGVEDRTAGVCKVCPVPPNVRAKRATTAGRQARAGENGRSTTGPGLVACR